MKNKITIFQFIFINIIVVNFSCYGQLVMEKPSNDVHTKQTGYKFLSTDNISIIGNWDGIGENKNPNGSALYINNDKSFETKAPGLDYKGNANLTDIPKNAFTSEELDNIVSSIEEEFKMKVSLYSKYLTLSYAQGGQKKNIYI